MADRTAPIADIRSSTLNPYTDTIGQTITHHVSIPGLKTRQGGPVVVEVTYTVHEVAEDWASFIVDYQFDSDPVVYGNHPMAIGSLREILPASYELPDYPASVRPARELVRNMLIHHSLGGHLVTGDMDGRTLEYHPAESARDNPTLCLAGITALIREYIPFLADVWRDDAREVVHIRPPRNEVKHVVRTS